MSARSCISFVLPAHDELASLPALLEEIRTAARGLDAAYEIVVVDDGSCDGSGPWLDDKARRAHDLVIVHLEPRRGQSAALAAGFDAARGDRIVTMDADLQNDPADSARLLAALEQFDVACGVRATRHDRLVKRVGSRIANATRRVVLHDRFRDIGCGLKAWRRPAVMALPRFTGFHRFLPVLAEAAGFRVTEVDVSHRPRLHGRTHYGELSRAVCSFRDMLGVRWLIRRRLPRGAWSGTPCAGGPRDLPRRPESATDPPTHRRALRS